MRVRLEWDERAAAQAVLVAELDDTRVFELLVRIMRNQRCECFLGGSHVLAEFKDDNVVLLDVDVLILLALVTAAASK